MYIFNEICTCIFSKLKKKKMFLRSYQGVFMPVPKVAANSAVGSNNHFPKSINRSEKNKHKCKCKKKWHQILIYILKMRVKIIQHKISHNLHLRFIWDIYFIKLVFFILFLHLKLPWKTSPSIDFGNVLIQDSIKGSHPRVFGFI